MEHCITRFFEECDPNKDKHITLQEWGHCFEIKEGKLIISPGRDMCSSPRQALNPEVPREVLLAVCSDCNLEATRQQCPG